jgi:predicted transcriptional regulator
MEPTTMGVKLDAETRARLKKLGEVKHRSPHWLMKEAIQRYLEVEEQYEQEKAEDLARCQEYLDTGTHITHTDMTAWLDELADRAARKAQVE